MAFYLEFFPMAVFLLVCVIFNAWFIFTSYRRAFSSNDSANLQGTSATSSLRYKLLLTYSVFCMALFDIPWVWMCMIQCWNNTFAKNTFSQDSGNHLFGCQFMGWYSTFSLVGMMGSHCGVAFYLMILLKHPESNDDNGNTTHGPHPWYETSKGFLALFSSLAILAILIGAMPLMQGDGYRLTNGGFCYADFTNPTQSAIMLCLVVLFLSLSTILWYNITVVATPGLSTAPRPQQWLVFYLIFFVTWFLWIPATLFGIATGDEIPSPYMLIGAILGHGNALINPILYGSHLFRLLYPCRGVGETTMVIPKEQGEDVQKETV